VWYVCLASYRPGLTLKQVGTEIEAMLKAKKLENFAGDFRAVIRYGGFNHMIGLATVFSIWQFPLLKLFNCVY